MLPLLAAGCAGKPPGGEPGPAGQTQAAVAEARHAAETGEYAYALERFMQALDDTHDPAVASQAAQLAIALERWESALAAAARWRTLEPESRQAVHVQLLGALSLRREEQAAEWLHDDLVATAADPAEAWVMATRVLARTGDPSLAARVIERALARADPAEPGLGDYLMSRVHAALDQRERAYRLAERAWRAGPGRDRALWAGQLARAQGRPETALEWFERAGERAPDDRAVLVGRVQLLRELERPDEALALLAPAPDDAELLYTRGVLEQELGRPAAAGATWQRLASLPSGEAGDRHAWLTALLAELLELNDRAVSWYERVDDGLRPRADLRRAAVMARTGETDAARALLRELRLDADPDIRERSWLLESGILVEADEPERAIELLSEGLAQLPGSEDLLYSRAMAAVNADDLALAEQDLRAMIQNDPENAAALNALGYTLADRTDRQREAVRLIETALALDPDNPAILDSMGWVLYRLGRPADALDYLQRAAGSDPHPEIVAHLVEVLWALDRREQARGWIARFEQDFGGEAVFSDTLERLGIE